MDAYDKNFQIPKVDVVHIDAGHTYEEVVYDINRFVNALDKPTFIFDCTYTGTRIVERYENVFSLSFTSRLLITIQS